MDWIVRNNTLLLFSSALSLLCLLKLCHASSEPPLEFSKAPSHFSHRTYAIFAFRASENCSTTCSFTCKLDNGIASKCESKRVSYSNLQDGKHTFEVCKNGLQGVVLGCVSYNWTIDTVPPTAYITTVSSFTNALNFTVNVSFTEPCSDGEGGFKCLSTNSCSLLVYGAGQVVPASLVVLEEDLKYSLVVSLSPEVLYGRLVLVMDKNFCADRAGNRFTRTPNSTFYLHYDRRSVFVNLRLHVPERLVELNGQTRTVLATNNYGHLKVYLYFSEPVLNSSTQIMSSLSTSQGSIVPIGADDIGNRRFGFLIKNVTSVSVVTLSFDSNLIISRPGTPVSPISPTTFLYDSKRPSVKLSTTSSTRTREHNIPIAITFVKPVFGFDSSNVSVSGGHVQSFHQISRSTYIIGVQASDDAVSVHVAENVTGDVSGNKNLASNVLQVRHYSVPLVSSVVSALVTASFLATCLVAGILTFSTSSLQTVWTFKGPSSLTADTTRNLFRIAYHIQVFAFSRWLAVMLPVEYYEFTSGLQWIIPYFHLPWENGHSSNVMVGSSPYTATTPYISESFRAEGMNSSTSGRVFGLPLDPMEYRFYFENPNIKPEAEALWDPQNTNGWINFERSMFWLALIAGSLVLLHIILLFFLKLRKKSPENQNGFGALTFPRFEIFLVVLALPCVSEVSAALIKGKDKSGVIVGILSLSVVALLLLAVLVFLSYGITFAKLLQYKEVHREGSTFRWYQELVRVTLGPGKRGQWTWKTHHSDAPSWYLVVLGPLFEDLRGPPKYMLSQITEDNNDGASASKRRGGAGDRIIASDDETEDAEAPPIQKLFGILRIYYAFLEIAKRVTLGVLAGVHMADWSPESTPSLTLLCLTSFQLFFLVLKKPFIKKRVQLAEIVSVSAEAGLFAACLAVSGREFSSGGESRLGVLMIALFLIGYVPAMAGEWWALRRQATMLDPEEKSALKGLRIALIGCGLVFLPQEWITRLERKYSGPRRSGKSSSRSSGSGSGSASGLGEKPWLKQLRELAKASFSREGGGSGVGAPTDPSSSQSGWSGLWGSKKNGSPGVSSDSKANPKPKGLYKDLEDIFASK